MARGSKSGGSKSGGNKTGGDKSGGGVRTTTERVRTARGRKIGSTRWLQRQLNDPYVQQAQKEGYRSRAAYKLQQIDDRLALLKPGLRIVDLGAAPGGWSQIVAQRVKPDESGGRVVAFDLTEMEPVAGVEILQGDILADDTPALILNALEGRADVVLCDIAASAMGHSATDHLRTMTLAEAALDLAVEILAAGGAFVVKVLQGADEPALFEQFRHHFTGVRRIKPPASRSESTEMYLVGTGFKTRP